MLTLPEEYCTLIAAFVPVFSKRVWRHVLVLLTGAILAPGQRTVAAVLRVMGLSDDRRFQNYHRVLNRAVWPSREISRRLLAHDATDQAHLHDHPLSLGCSLVPASATSTGRQSRPTAAERSSVADVGEGGRRHQDGLDVRDGPNLVWRSTARD